MVVSTMDDGGIDWNAFLFFTVTAVVTLLIDALRRFMFKWIDSIRFNDDDDKDDDDGKETANSETNSDDETT